LTPLNAATVWKKRVLLGLSNLLHKPIMVWTSYVISFAGIMVLALGIKIGAIEQTLFSLVFLEVTRRQVNGAFAQ